jgi:hypothetical protein
VEKDWIISKRQLGILLAVAGALGFVSILAVDLLRAHGAVGPSQMLALAGCFVLGIVGLTLLPLGDRPA